MPPAGLSRCGQGRIGHGNPAPTSTPSPFSITDLRELLREVQEGRNRALCGRVFPGNWDSLPILSSNHCHCWGQAAPGSLQGPPGDPGFWVPLNSDFPRKHQEVSRVSLGVNPGSATYWFCDLV